MKSPKIGSRCTKNGVSIDVHAIGRGEVYVRRWPKAVWKQALFNNLIRLPLAVFGTM